MDPAPRPRLHLALFIVSLCFGAFSVVGKLALRDPAVTPFALTELRMLGAALAFTAAAALRREAWPDLATTAKLAGLALLGTVVNQALFLTGLKKTGATEATLLVGSIPLFTFALGRLLGREAGGAGKWLGLNVALGGVTLLLVTRGARFERDHFVGDLLIVVNCLSYSLYLVFAKPLLRTLPSVRAMGTIFLCGALLFAPLGLPPLIRLPWPALPPATLSALAFVVVFPTIVAYFLNVWALKRAPASLVAIYVLLQPLVAALLAALPPLSERPTAPLLLAGLLIVAGVAIFSRGE